MVASGRNIGVVEALGSLHGRDRDPALIRAQGSLTSSKMTNWLKKDIGMDTSVHEHACGTSSAELWQEFERLQ